MSKRKARRHGRPPDPRRGRWRAVGVVATMVLGVAVVLGLNLAGRRPPAADRDAESHGHPPGPHGGAVVAIDRDNRFHAEAVFEPDGTVRLYTFGEDLAAGRPVVAQTVCAAVRGHGGGEEYAVMLRPEPQGSDPPGSASRFAARTPPAAWGGHLRLVVWALPVGGERFLFEVEGTNPPPDAAAAERAAGAEVALYTTPGGKYREADIRANGGVAASRKYRGQRTAHDDRPAAGDRVCPVSRSRADARFVWLIDGKEYRFCCPPCIDEFVTAAKERPDEVQEPNSYRR